MTAFQTKVVVTDQVSETPIGARRKHSNHLPYFANELNRVAYKNNVPLVCYIARSLYYEGTSWNLVMAAALYIGAKHEAYDPEAGETAKQMIIKSGKGADILERLNKIYLPQVREPNVVWPELMIEIPLDSDSVEKEDSQREKDKERKIIVPPFGGGNKGPKFQYASEGRPRQKLLDPEQEKDTGCCDGICITM